MDAITAAPLPANASLQGPLLEAYLDEAETLSEQTSPGLSDNEALRALLHAQTMQPQTLPELFRICNLWVHTGEPQHALAALNTHGEALVQDLPAAEQHEARISLGFYHLKATCAQPADTASMQACMQAMQTLLTTPAVDQQSDHAWEYLQAQAEEYGQHDTWRACVLARHRLATAQPARKLFRAWDDAVLALRLGQACADQGQSAAAHQHALEAIRSLQHAAPGQDVDHDDWLRLGERLATLMPQGMETVRQQVQARLPAAMPLPQQRDVWVKMERLMAQAQHAQGQLEQALVHARAGRFGLTSDSGETFSSLVMDWLMEAGRDEDAAQLALECIANERSPSDQHAAQRAKEHLDKAAAATPLTATWHTALAWAAHMPDTDGICGDEEANAFKEHHLQIALALEPHHPGALALQGLMAYQKRDFGQALPLLERAARNPAFSTCDVLKALWTCRARLHGIDKAIQMPFVTAQSGGWCYNMGVWIDMQWQDEMEMEPWPETAATDLAARYYELGQLHFEAFFATGEGTFRDADVHTYSMLCNNLAIYRRYAQQQYDKAIELHRKGLDASPFAEHWDGLMKCQIDAERKADFIATADTLWHYAQDYGYGRHNPAWYFKRVTTALYELDRDKEISIWLQRLQEWWQALDSDEREDPDTLEDYLGAQLVILRDMAWSQPADVLLRLQSVLPEARKFPLPGVWRLAGVALERAGQLEQAMTWYEDALKKVRPGNENDVEQAGYTREEIARCKKKIRAAKPWWKIW